ncbi:LuxR family transcriptional regulator [Collinsella tanakaei]|uniref:LuxR C-terminal-related transcriptional regulator n=1 Tax=Collinsella tanakaei TaxID=626935 RepID=UPI00195C5241|nr:LuxR C-terminal-related transcriptional regulator [Collinsella tanakaei]MBM6756103.1 LuxR family transcriptional regulator [Collinsella tanakaei]
MLPISAIEWFYVTWYYVTNFVAPIILFVLAVLVAVKYLRSGRRDKKVAEQTVPAVPPETTVEADAARAKLEHDLERARLEVDLADAGLTRRERTVLLAVCDGMTLAAIADDLGVSRSTAGTYSTRAYEKLGVSTREEAQAWLARCAFAHGLADRGLTPGEVDAALMAADGASTAKIAEKLVLSEAAVNSRLQQVYGKLRIHGRAELAALRNGA